MKIPDACFQMVSNQYTNFQKNPCTHLLEHAWTKSCSQTGDRQTDGHGEANIPPPPNFVWKGGGYKNFVWGGGGIIIANVHKFWNILLSYEKILINIQSVFNRDFFLYVLPITFTNPLSESWILSVGTRSEIFSVNFKLGSPDGHR